MRKIALIVSVLMVAVISLSACGSTPEPEVIVETVEVEKVVTEVVTATPQPEGEPAEDAKMILRVGTGDSGEGLNPHQEIIARFEEENPDILVQLEAVSGRA